jgi:FkbM family methyltransferase
VFPDAALHLIEPQPACASALAEVQAATRTTVIHAVAVSRPGRDRVRMADSTTGSSGARVIGDNEVASNDSWLPATTLDVVMANRLVPADRVLLKLDLEGHEIDALEGASWLLPRVDVLITEVQFFDVDHSGLPTFMDVMIAIGRYGFVLDDIAALASRPRDGRLRIGDLIFIRNDSRLRQDDAWA